MSFKITGLNELKKSLNNLAENAKSLDGQYDFDEIFSEKFMKSHTKYKSIYDFFSDNNIPTDQEEFESFPTEDLDRIVKRTTSFQNWEFMFNSAIEELIYSKLKW